MDFDLRTLLGGLMAAKRERGTIVFAPTPKRKGTRPAKAPWNIVSHKGRHAVKDAKIVH